MYSGTWRKGMSSKDNPTSREWMVQITLTRAQDHKISEGWEGYAKVRPAPDGLDFISTKLKGKEVEVTTRAGVKSKRVIDYCYRDVTYNTSGDPTIIVVLR